MRHARCSPGVIGLGSATSHNFCTVCDLDIDDLDITDRREWPPKSQEHIRRIGMMWRNAPTTKERDLIFDSFGIRWSPLHLLPYWNPVRYTVIDPMHALDLNLFQNHCRTIFQIDIKYPGTDGSSAPITTSRQGISTKEHLRSLQRCVELIQLNGPNMLTELIRHPRLILYTICVDNSILGPGNQMVVGTKWVLANNIHAWVRSPTTMNEVIDNCACTDIEVIETKGRLFHCANSYPLFSFQGGTNGISTPG